MTTRSRPATRTNSGATARNEKPTPSSAIAPLLEAWFRASARDLPWRQSRNGYFALVSELMLQQTQVARVLEKFAPFVARFPSPAALASASEDEVLAAWQGLGYYRRARFLQAAARRIVEVHAGEVPSDLESLAALPGVGRYTAGSIASIVFGVRTPIVDGNVARVLQRVEAKAGASNDPSVSAWTWERARHYAVAAEDISVANEALMEFGGTICTPAAPRCSACPIAHLCQAHVRGRVAQIPAPKIRPPRSTVWMVCVRVTRDDGAVLLEQRPAQGLWASMYQPPTMEISVEQSTGITPARAAKLVAIACKCKKVGELEVITSHRVVRFVVFDAQCRGETRMANKLVTSARLFVCPADLSKFALSNAAKRLLALEPA